MIIWAIWYGVWPERDIDHEDHDGLNNRIRNLRLATESQNGGNRRIRSSLRGAKAHLATFRNEELESRICINYRCIHVGFFLTEREAALAWDAAAKIVWGEFACLNFPPEESSHVVLPDRVLRKIEASRLSLK
jgi:HNH endonuclease